MIVSVRLAPYRLLLRDPWPTAEGAVPERHGCWIALEDQDGRVGLGDSAPLPGFHLETIASSVAALRTAARRLIGLPADAWLEGAANLTHLAPVAASPAARHAIDLALHDLAAQRAGRSIAALLAADAIDVVPVNASIPRVEPERAVALARDAVAGGASTLKIKVGGAPLAEDLARVRAVRDEVGDGVAIRLDANQSWSEAEAVAAIGALAAYDLEYVEQPIPAAELAALARVRRAVSVPIAADESVVDARTARRLIAMGAADLLILKPMVLGGLHTARVVAAEAAAGGVEVVVTSFLESAIGRTGALHLAASLGPARRAHGLATGSALTADLAEAPVVESGALRLPRGAGLGITLDADRLQSATLVEAA